MTSTKNCSVSRLAVPLPMATMDTPCLRISPSTVALACATRPWLGKGKITPVSSTRPVGSTTATLHPVRMPGSRPMATRPRTGGCISSGFRFMANTRIAAV